MRHAITQHQLPSTHSTQQLLLLGQQFQGMSSIMSICSCLWVNGGQAQVLDHGDDLQHQVMEMALAASPFFPPYCPAASLKPMLPSSGKLPCPCPPAQLFQGSCWVWKLGLSSLFWRRLFFLISCPGTRPSSISPMLMAAHGSSASYWQGSDIGWTPQGCLCKHQWKRGRVAFTCIYLLGLLLPPQMPQPSRAMPAET